MIGFIVQNWRTVRVAQAQTSFTQAEGEWIDLRDYEDLTLWLDLKSVQAPGVNVEIHYETSPNRDDLTFKSMGSVTLNTALGSTPWLTNVILDRNPTLALGRWFRWKLKTSASPTGRWGACFRLLATATPMGPIGSG